MSAISTSTDWVHRLTAIRLIWRGFQGEMTGWSSLVRHQKRSHLRAVAQGAIRSHQRSDHPCTHEQPLGGALLRLFHRGRVLAYGHGILQSGGLADDTAKGQGQKHVLLERECDAEYSPADNGWIGISSRTEDPSSRLEDCQCVPDEGKQAAVVLGETCSIIVIIIFVCFVCVYSRSSLLSIVCVNVFVSFFLYLLSCQQFLLCTSLSLSLSYFVFK